WSAAASSRRRIIPSCSRPASPRSTAPAPTSPWPPAKSSASSRRSAWRREPPPQPPPVPRERKRTELCPSPAQRGREGPAIAGGWGLLRRQPTLWPRHRRAVINHLRMAVLFLIVFIDLVGFGVVIPLLPYYALRFDASPLTVTSMMACYSLAQFVASPLLGRLS